MNVEDWLGADNQLGIDIWNKKYRYGDESFDDWLDRVSGGDAEVRQLIVQKKFLFGGRILANRGLDKKGVKVTLSNCYVLAPPEDNIESIFETASKMARTFSYGGGVGVDLSKLAPRGAKINNTAEETSGAVSFTDLYSMVTGLIGQHGRRGALMLSMSCDHPDVEEFMRVKTDLERVTKANMSIRVTDEFMECVRDSKKFIQTFTRPETGDTVTKTIDAREFFTELCDANYDYGEPGCLFWDRIDNWNILSEYDDFRYAGTNPCVRGDTLILTDKGWKEIQSLVGTTVNVWNGQEWSEANPRITGFNQKMLKITTSDGCSVDCTHYHKFHLADGSVIPANELRIGDKLAKCSFPNIHESKVEFDPLMYTYGAFQGDGSRDYVRGRAFLYLYGDKKKLAEHCTDIVRYSYEDTRDVYKLTNCPAEVFSKTFIPMDGTLSQKLSWLAGYIDTDGCRNSADGSVTISSIDKDMLMKVKLMLNTIGCTGSINVMREKGLRPMPDGKGGYADFECQKSYRLVISARNVEKLLALGLTLHRVEVAPHTNRDAQRFITITGIENTEDADIVYCMTEPKVHRFIANGMIVGNCAEEPLPAGGSCLLGSINLAAFVDGKNFQLDEFERAIKIAIRALNDVLDEGQPLHPLEEQRESVKNWRQIGLGIMGLADMLIKMEIPYNSPTARFRCTAIADTMACWAILASCELAVEFGAFPMCDSDKIANSNFIKNLGLNVDSPKLFEGIKTNGLRNSQLLSIAPTGTISTMLGISGGIEPIFSKSYTRVTKSLDGGEKSYKVYTPIVKEYMDAHGLTDESQLPEWFVTAQDIGYEDRVDMQATWQKYIDASISSTVNLPEDFPREKVMDIYMRAWKRGCKGITVFRDGCKRDSILTTKDTSERGVIESVGNDVIGKKRKLMTGCGSLHCSAFFDPVTGKLKEVFLNKGSTGGCNNYMIGLSRMISLAARSGCELDDIVGQLKSCGSCPSYAVRRATKKDTSEGSCCPMAVANALIEMRDEMQGKSVTKSEVTNPCPQCGAELEFQGGCNVCKSCGWTKCD